MEQIYEFSDWTSASKMKNKINSKLKIDVSVLLKEVSVVNDDDLQERDVQGYKVKVYDSITSEPEYVFYVDCSLPDHWGLTTEEAITALNLIGFPCQYRRDKYIISDEVRKILKSLQGLGYSRIFREACPAEVYALSKDTIILAVPLSKITEYNYQDFNFLSTTPVDINTILEG